MREGKKIWRPITIKMHRFVLKSSRKIRKLLNRIPGNHRKLILTISEAVGISLIVFGIITFAYFKTIDNSYKLSPKLLSVIGSPDQNILRKFSYDKQSKSYFLAKSDIGNKSAGMKSVGDGAVSGYSSRLSLNSSRGITTYDNSQNLSFTLTPEFKTMDARASNGHVIYPTSVNGPKLVYTIKHNGTQEDIVYSKASSNSASYKYRLDLPTGLEAKKTSDGNIGIYSADSYLYGNISYGSDADKQKVDLAKQKAAKNNLVFVIPAPTIVAKGSNKAKTSIELKNNEITISATNLSSIKGAFSIDPSVVVASIGSFQNGGNNEGDITYDSTNNQIYQSGIGGGEISSWTTSANSVPRYVSNSLEVIYNNYIYIIGGYDGATWFANTYYAPISSNGNVGTFSLSTSVFPNLSSGVSGAANLGGTAYNGYIFAGAGQNSASATSAGYYFAAVCTGNNTTSQFSVNCDKSSSPGSISSWKAESNSLPAAEQKPNVTAYNGYLYNIQGFTANTYYSKISADGSIGPWSTGATMATSGAGGYSVIYNNYIYYIGGTVSGVGVSNSYYAQIQSGGNIGSWQSTSSLPAARSIASGAIYGGYVYLIGGSSNTTTYFSQINTDGTLGKWQTSVNNLSSSLGTSLNSGINSYNGNLYYINGNGNIFKTTASAPGLLSGWTSTSSSLSNIKNFESVAYNGYIYVMGGTDGTNYLTTSYYAAICTGQNTTTAFATNCTTSSSAGSLSSWGTTTSLSLASSQGTAIAVNGYMYLMGGLSASSTISNKTYYSAINPDGTLAGWNVTTNLPNYIYSAVSVVYGGYIYVIGGVSSATSSVSSGASSSAIYYASYNNSGTVNSWTSSVSLPVATQQSTASAYGGYLYLLGGNTGSSTANVYYAQLNSNGSLGAFTLNTNSLPAASAQGCSFVSNGYIYYLGGYNSNTYYAQIASNGSLGSFNSTTSTINPNSSSGLGAMGSVIYQGYAYYMGGWDQTNYNSNTYYSQIFNGGSGQTNGWYTSANLLPAGYTGASVSVYNGRIYLFRNTVLYATLNSDGSIGAWSYTTSIPFNAYGQSSFMYNGFAYVMGGFNNVTSTYCPSGLGSIWTCNDVLRAPINSNGTLGSWTLLSATPIPMPVGVETFGLETFGLQQWNGYVYIFGGLNINNSGVYAAQSAAYYAKINSDGSLGSWTATSNLPSANANFASAVYNGYIYMIGGAYNSNGNKTYYAKINSDGSLGSWNATSSLLENRVGVQSVAYDGYIYVFGGSLGNGYIPPNSTEYAPINANGSIGNWYTSTASSFLVSNSSFEGTGGCSSTGWSARNGSSITTSNTNAYTGYGSCSMQVTSTTATGGAAYSLSLQPSTTYNLSMNIKASGSTITDLAIGYQNNGVDTAGICPTTTTGYNSASGASTTSFTLFYCTFTTPASVTGTVNIYVSATTNAADVFYVDNVVFLTQPGSPSPVLPDSLQAYGLAANNGYVYIVSGASQYSSQGQAYSATSRTYYTALQSIPRIGYYSQLQDLTGSSSQDPTPFELSVNGGACASGSACSTSSINNLPTSGSGGLNGPGGVSIAYAFARNICTAFNSSVNLTYISTLFGTIQPATNTTSACSSPNNAIGNSRYVWTRYTIDDSQTATFPDSLSNKTTISNYNWYYHAANNARLRGGSSFGNNSLQTLDTPP